MAGSTQRTRTRTTARAKKTRKRAAATRKRVVKPPRKPKQKRGRTKSKGAARTGPSLQWIGRRVRDKFDKMREKPKGFQMWSYARKVVADEDVWRQVCADVRRCTTLRQLLDFVQARNLHPAIAVSMWQHCGADGVCSAELRSGTATNKSVFGRDRFWDAVRRRKLRVERIY